MPELAEVVPAYLAALTAVAQEVMRGVAVSLDLPEDYFASGYTADPTVLFRVFHYPPSPAGDDGWGVGEHTDYGLLTLLAQDGNGGLQVRTPGGWIDAPPVPGTFVCNIGDMLDRLTGGWYRSTPHRVRNVSGNERLSFPFFFDPDFSAEVPPLPGPAREGADGHPAGTARTCALSPERTATTCWARWARSSRNCAARSCDRLFAQPGTCCSPESQHPSILTGKGRVIGSPTAGDDVDRSVRVLRAGVCRRHLAAAVQQQP
ncbi:2OG-Fe(II) oxygenase family protein [Catellatospora coxensis]